MRAPPRTAARIRSASRCRGVFEYSRPWWMLAMTVPCLAYRAVQPRTWAGVTGGGKPGEMRPGTVALKASRTTRRPFGESTFTCTASDRGQPVLARLMVRGRVAAMPRRLTNRRVWRSPLCPASNMWLLARLTPVNPNSGSASIISFDAHSLGNSGVPGSRHGPSGVSRFPMMRSAWPNKDRTFRTCTGVGGFKRRASIRSPASTTVTAPGFSTGAPWALAGNDKTAAATRAAPRSTTGSPQGYLHPATVKARATRSRCGSGIAPRPDSAAPAGRS